jgi:hypothetical protein
LAWLFKVRSNQNITVIKKYQITKKASPLARLFYGLYFL